MFDHCDIADKESRIFQDNKEWRLDPQIFKVVTQKLIENLPRQLSSKVNLKSSYKKLSTYLQLYVPIQIFLLKLFRIYAEAAECTNSSGPIT